ncbi:hypothetical protein ABPG74_019825 [Tetrahymena malaccensis]
MENVKSDLKIIQSLVIFSIQKQQKNLERWAFQTFRKKNYFKYSSKYKILNFEESQSWISKEISQLQKDKSNINLDQIQQIVKFILSVFKQKITAQNLYYDHNYEFYCRYKGFQNNSNQSEDDSDQENEQSDQKNHGEEMDQEKKNLKKQQKTKIEMLNKSSKSKLINFLIVKYKVFLQRLQQKTEQTQDIISEINGLSQLIKLLILCKKIILNDQFISYSLQIDQGQFNFKSWEVFYNDYEYYGFKYCGLSEYHECIAELPDHTLYFNRDFSQKKHLIKNIILVLDGAYSFYTEQQFDSFPQIKINSPFSEIIVNYIQNEKSKIDLSLIKIISCKKITFEIAQIENIMDSFDKGLEIFEQNLEIMVNDNANFQNYNRLQNLIIEKTNKDPCKILDILISDHFQNWIPNKYDQIDKFTTKEQKFNEIIKNSTCLDQFFANKAFLIFQDKKLNIAIQTVLQLIVLQKFQSLFNIQIAKLSYFLVDDDA